MTWISWPNASRELVLCLITCMKKKYIFSQPRSKLIKNLHLLSWYLFSKLILNFMFNFKEAGRPIFI